MIKLIIIALTCFSLGGFVFHGVDVAESKTTQAYRVMKVPIKSTAYSIKVTPRHIITITDCEAVDIVYQCPDIGPAVEDTREKRLKKIFNWDD